MATAFVYAAAVIGLPLSFPQANQADAHFVSMATLVAAIYALATLFVRFKRYPIDIGGAICRISSKASQLTVDCVWYAVLYVLYCIIILSWRHFYV